MYSVVMSPDANSTVLLSVIRLPDNSGSSEQIAA